MGEYEEFLASKSKLPEPKGLDGHFELSSKLFPFQRDIVQWALEKGRAAIFADCGLGKSFMQLEWARVIAERTGGRVLILAPLAVSSQTIREASKLGIRVDYVKEQSEVTGAISVTNYERIAKFDASQFQGVVLDESGILKSFMGATKRMLCEAFESTPYRLACTATPAPNDHIELGNHSAFLGILPAFEMLTRWFINDTSLFGNYRLKGHAETAFWDWVCSWARCVSKPSDLGYADDGYVLPELVLEKHVVDVDVRQDAAGMLFRVPDMSATSVHKEKRITADARAVAIANLVKAEPHESWLLWCDTDYEADAVRAVLPEATDVRGSDKPEAKEKALLGFADGSVRVLLTKPKLAGLGLNFQHCARVGFVGASFSYEQFYQSVRRCWRFGQTRPVHVHVAMGQTELEMWNVLSRKKDLHSNMSAAMSAAMRRREEKATRREVYRPMRKIELPTWLKERAS